MSHASFGLKTHLVAVLCLLALSSAKAGQTAVVGAMTRVVPALQKTTVGLPFQPNKRLPEHIGTVSAMGSDYIDSVSSQWEVATFTNSGTPYYVRFTSGLYSGILFRVASTPNTPTRVYIQSDANNLGPAAFGITVGDTFEVVPGLTLGSLFPNAALGGSDSAATANTVSIWGGASFLVFYYNTVRSRWERDTDTAASPSRDNQPISPDSGLLIQNRGSATLSFKMMGQVALTDTPVRLTQPGTSFVPLNIPLNTTLGRLALQSPGTSFNWIGAGDCNSAATTADLVQVLVGSTWVSFYYDTARGRWQKVKDASNASANDTPLVAGTAIMVRRVKAASMASDRMLFLNPPGSY